jgi:hypothetical protein
VKGPGVVRKLHLLVLLHVRVSRLAIWPVCIALVLPELKYASVFSINLTFRCSGKLDNIQRKCCSVVVMDIFS